jgi:hypothetical protein
MTKASNGTSSSVKMLGVEWHSGMPSIGMTQATALAATAPSAAAAAAAASKLH